MIYNPNKLIIIAGCQRSGTTLMGQILGAHPDTFLIDENDGVYKWFDMLLANRPDIDGAVDKVLQQAAKKYLDSRSSVRNSEEIVGKSLVLKVPNLTYRSPEIAELHQITRVIFPIRHPLAVVASMKSLTSVTMIDNQRAFITKIPDLAERFEPEVCIIDSTASSFAARAAAVWVIKNRLIADFEQKGLCPLSIKYDDLVQRIDTTVKKVVEYCEIRWNVNWSSPRKMDTSIRTYDRYWR